ncbi:MAG TPA: hypothetical protein VJ281_00590 [Chthoniobacterales bacterium]|jgi:hypothetical protein|nr:hypothetical protein [Chthoniobacterales bacterium]
MKTVTLILLSISMLSLSSAYADQPHLRAAKAELAAAEHNKGGWRDRAIHNVNQAIADTERGMAFAR